jgi:cyclase
VKDVGDLLEAGADKISINSIAVKDPSIIHTLASEFGSQCIVCAIDVRRNDVTMNHEVYVSGGRIATGLDALRWAKEVEDRGAGEILLTSMDNDGTKNGFALDITRAISDLVNIPIIASGGAGSKEHFLDVFNKGGADAALAASIFHFSEIPIPELKIFLHKHGIPIRLKH